LKAAERDADAFVELIKELEESVKKIESDEKAITTTDKKRKLEINRLRAHITNLKAQRDAPPIEFNAMEWNERVVSTCPELYFPIN
jgi:phage shock protein A